MREQPSYWDNGLGKVRTLSHQLRVNIGSLSEYCSPLKGLMRLICYCNLFKLAAFGGTLFDRIYRIYMIFFILTILLILSKKWKFLYYELSALRADFSDRIYRIS